MFSGLTLILSIVAILFPFIGLLSLIIPANKILLMGQDRKIDTFSLFNNLSLGDLFSIKSYIYENFDMFEDNDKNKIYNMCLNVRNGFFLHLVTGFLYLFLLIILVINIFTDTIFKNTIPIADQFLSIISLSIPFSLFYLTPFLNLIGKSKWAALLESLITKILHFPDLIAKYAWRYFIYILRFIILFIYMNYVIKFQSSFDKLLPNDKTIRFEIFYYIVFLFIYHYGINYLLGNFFNRFDKKIYPNISKELSRKLQKNNNYLFMLIIYVIAVIFKNETSGMFISITLIFLYDTFIIDKQNILLECKKSPSGK